MDAGRFAGDLLFVSCGFTIQLTNCGGRVEDEHFFALRYPIVRFFVAIQYVGGGAAGRRMLFFNYTLPSADGGTFIVNHRASFFYLFFIRGIGGVANVKQA